MNFSPPNCDLICSPSTLNDKATQSGELSADNLISTTTTTCSPSKCLNCQMVNKTTSRTLLDGILRITTEKFIVLCNIHLSADSTPPSTPTYLEPDHTVPDLDISINTQDILTSLEQNPDPLNLLPISTNHQTFDSLPAAPPTSLLHLPTSFNRKKKRSSQTKYNYECTTNVAISCQRILDDALAAPTWLSTDIPTGNTRGDWAYMKCVLAREGCRARIVLVKGGLMSPVPKPPHDVQYSETYVHVAKQKLRRNAAQIDQPTKLLVAEAVSRMNFERRTKLNFQISSLGKLCRLSRQTNRNYLTSPRSLKDLILPPEYITLPLLWDSGYTAERRRSFLFGTPPNHLDADHLVIDRKFKSVAGTSP
ncbi:hypothetical protein ACHWQZ_G010668 [Mnemiopsis leidyi]